MKRSLNNLIKAHEREIDRFQSIIQENKEDYEQKILEMSKNV